MDRELSIGGFLVELEAKYVFIANALVALFFGLGFIFSPNMILEMCGPITGGAGEIMGVHYGIAVTMLAVFMLLIRNQPHSDFRQSVFLYLIFSWAMTFIYQVYMIYAFGYGNPVWITTVAIDFILVVLYGYLYYTNMSS
jgi:hypothetical protein